MKAIETVYDGHRFRSRLEARWAVFFNTAGIKYEYEPEGFELKDGTRYLPDFYLPELDVYAEVKADSPEAEEDIKRAKRFIEWGGKIKTIIILSTIPGECDGGLWHFPCFYWDDHDVTAGWWFFYDDEDGVIGNVSGAPYLAPFPVWRNDYVFSPKAVSDKVLRKECPFEYKDYGMSVEAEIELELWQNRQTYEAYGAARKARFEYGEHGS